jgi:nucleotide-binding universal stress UspA family protein
MTKRILVPVDRMEETVAALALIGDAARSSGAVIRLLHVAPVPENVETATRVVAYADQEMARLEAEGMDFLQMLQTRLPGIPTECVVRFGHPVEEILQEADGFDADLIVVLTRSRSALTRAVLGSVAEAVLRKARTAVMLLRPAQ